MVKSPGYRVTWINKARALLNLGRNQEGLAAAEQAITLQPDDAVAWFNKGSALEKLRRYQEALEAYDREFDRGDAQNWHAHARVYRALGRTAEAEAAERRAKELGG